MSDELCVDMPFFDEILLGVDNKVKITNQCSFINLVLFRLQKYYGRPPLYPIFFVTLRVGTREFIGEGTTAQQAKHNAASKALKLMKQLPMPENATTCTQGGKKKGVMWLNLMGLFFRLPKLECFL